MEKTVIQRPVFSLMLVNGQDGVLSFGGTAANAIDLVESQTKAALDALAPEQQEVVLPSKPDSINLVKRGRKSKDVITREPDWDDGWAWNEVQGADGWWQILMRGVWVDGSKVLSNQAVVVDVGVSLFELHSRVRFALLI